MTPTGMAWPFVDDTVDVASPELFANYVARFVKFTATTNCAEPVARLGRTARVRRPTGTRKRTVA